MRVYHLNILGINREQIKYETNRLQKEGFKFRYDSFMECRIQANKILNIYPELREMFNSPFGKSPVCELHMSIIEENDGAYKNWVIIRDSFHSDKLFQI